MNRRTVLRRAAAGGAALAGVGLGTRAAFVTGGGPTPTTDPFALDLDPIDDDPTSHTTEVDYVVIGSGAGGAPVAARLARAGHTVLVLEAGPFDIDRTRYTVPAFHLLASSDPSMGWDFYVRHYTDRAAHGTGFVAEKDGILYPRAATLGGCTAHHAMLTLYPENADWDNLARLTGDQTWNSFAMRRYFDRVREWLPIEQAPAEILLRDRVLTRLVAAAVAETGTLGRGVTDGSADLNRLDVTGLGFDPNAENSVDRNHEGLFLIPQSTTGGHRAGTRALLADVQRRHPDRLLLQSNALVERIVLDQRPDGTLAATAVEFLHGRYLYAASPRSRPVDADQRGRIRRRVTARREVILAGGAFNSPQVLMLSGIGPADHLRQHGISCRLDLPGVGGNLQDRYEMSVVTEHDRPFNITQGATFGAPGDPMLADYRAGNPFNPYRTNGILVGMKQRYSGGSAHPELFVFGSPSRFDGYAPGFAAKAVAGGNHFTWAVLRGYTENDSGTVRLRSADPTDTPDINFRYFDDGRGGTRDLAAVREAIDLARRINSRADRLGWLDQVRQREVFPGPGPGDTGRLDDFIRRQAWGHHASCSNPMGPPGDPKAVVDSRFLVHGTNNLRVVDASVFRRIPGLFPVLAIFMLAEKASDVIAEDAHRTAGAR